MWAMLQRFVSCIMHYLHAASGGRASGDRDCMRDVAGFSSYFIQWVFALLLSYGWERGATSPTDGRRFLKAMSYRLKTTKGGGPLFWLVPMLIRPPKSSPVSPVAHSRIVIVYYTLSMGLGVAHLRALHVQLCSHDEATTYMVSILW